MGHSVFELENRNGKIIKGNKWTIDDKEPKAYIVIIHGMSEYSFRYDEFAKFLNSNGYDVYALDHLGHGLNCPDKSKLGIWPKDGFEQCVNNVADLIQKLQKDKKEVYVFAHSMGSFMGQSLMERYPGLVKKIVLCGSSGPQFVHKMGNIIASLHVHGKPEKPSNFMNNLSFGAYGKKITDSKEPMAWLSWNKENVAKYERDDYCGFIQSRMFYKSFMGGLSKLHIKNNLNKIDVNQKVLIVVGADDPVGNYGKTLKKLNQIYKKHGMDSNLIIYPHMRHEILNEDKKMDVMKDTLEFFEK